MKVIENEYKRLYGTMRHIKVKAKEKIKRRGRFYYIGLKPRHHVWCQLCEEARDLARKMGAINWRSDDVFCPEFDDKNKLIEWFMRAYELGLVDKRIVEEVLK